MNKTDLIACLADVSGYNKKHAKIYVEIMLKTISDGIISGEGVEIRGFGMFSKKYRKPHSGFNPKTLEKITVAGKYLPFFKPGKTLKEQINS